MRFIRNRLIEESVSYRCLVITKKTRAMKDILDTEERKELPDNVFGLPGRREYPMPDASHVRAAEAYFRYCPKELKPELARNILRFAEKYGIEIKSPVILQFAKE